jgi:hypothetical protein
MEQEYKKKLMYEKIIKERPVPKVLISFLNLPEDTCMRRPEVMRKLKNKLRELGLYNIITLRYTLDESSVKALKLNDEDIGRVINSIEFISFFVSFYPKNTNYFKLLS